MGGKGNKRVQVALRPPVLSLTEDYAKQQGISNSAAISRLVEEGLTRRGMLEAPSGFAEVPMASKSPDAVVMRSLVFSCTPKLADADSKIKAPVPPGAMVKSPVTVEMVGTFNVPAL